MATTTHSGFSEDAPTWGAAADFVDAERERLRAGQLDATAIETAAAATARGVASTPSPAIDDVPAENLRTFGALWLSRHQSIVRNLPIGTVLAVDLGSGMYVMATSRLAAMDRFEDVFGLQRSAWVHEVGVPITLGGGLWALRSGA